MKKIIPLRSDLLALISGALALIFVLVGQTAAGKDKCDVCHNDKNPHTISIPCDQVDKYLANHPGDYAGPCQGITTEKPPKDKDK